MHSEVVPAPSRVDIFFPAPRLAPAPCITSHRIGGVGSGAPHRFGARPKAVYAWPLCMYGMYTGIIYTNIHAVNLSCKTVGI